MTEQQIAAVKQALEALESTRQPIYSLAPLHEAIPALRRALEQQPAAPEGLVQAYEWERSERQRLEKAAQWVGLTDEEAQKTFAEHNCEISTHLAGILARAIKAKLKEKNT